MDLMKYNPIIDIEVGARVPDFILIDDKDKTIRLSDLRGSQLSYIFILRILVRGVRKRHATSGMYITISVNLTVQSMGSAQTLKKIMQYFHKSTTYLLNFV